MRILSLASHLSFLLFASQSLALPAPDDSLVARSYQGGYGANDKNWRKGCYDGPSNGVENSSRNRQKWSRGFDIRTDWEKRWPKGKIRCFELDIANQKIWPDGYERDAMTINGQYPGPPIIVDWGDTVRVKVNNKLRNRNGTTIHWHGIRQQGNVLQDGVPGVTQCPILPGSSQIYEWTASQYGTSWYHTHFASQYGDGVVAPLIIRGPSSENYDVELKPLLLTDWYHTPTFTLAPGDFRGIFPRSDSNLVNGKGIYNCTTADPKCRPERGGLEDVLIEKGKRYKLRLISTAIATQFSFWIDDHDFKIIATDFVPVEPFKTDTLNIAPGQRYDLIIEAKADISKNSNFWINIRQCQRARPAPPATTSSAARLSPTAAPGEDAPAADAPALPPGQATALPNAPDAPNVVAGNPLNGIEPSPSNPESVDDGPVEEGPADDALNNVGLGKRDVGLVKRQARPPPNPHLAILRYKGGKGFPENVPDNRLTFGCEDPKLDQLVPMVSKRVGVDPDGIAQFEAGQFPWPNQTDDTSALHSWALGDASLKLNWSEPTVKRLMEGKEIPPEYVGTSLENEGKWEYFVILDTFTPGTEGHKINGPAVPHPIHLHGHDVSIIAQSNTTYDPNNLQLKLDNPPRRDVAILPAGGFLIIAFETNNPGAWLLHCHIVFHSGTGMAFQFIELKDKFIKQMRRDPARDDMLDQCRRWKKFYNTEDEGSGI